MGTRGLVKQRGENSFAELDLVNLSVEEVHARLEGLERYPQSRRWLMRRLLIGRWLELDSEGAFAWCREQSMANFFSGNMSLLLRQWMEIDPEAAMAAWRSLPDGALRARQLGSLLEGAMKLGPEVYLRYLDQLPVDSLKSSAGVSEMFAELAAMDRELAIARLGALPENLREEASAGIVDAWVNDDPAGAIAYTKEMQAGGTRDHCLSKILDSDWALDHPDDAGALMELFSVRPGLVPSSGVSAVFEKLREGDPMAAVTWAAKYLEPGDAFSGLINREVIAPAIKNSPETVPALVASISTTIGDAEAAKEWAGTLGDGILIRNIAERWVEVADAPSDWMPWAEAIADPAQREQAWSGIAQAFAKEDTAAASKWLGGLPADDPARDGAVAAFLNGVATRDAEAALVWAETIGAPETRTAALQSVVDRLAWNNPAHAREIVASAPVDESIRQQLLYRIDHP